MAVSTGHMSTTPPAEQPWLACIGQHPAGRGPAGSQEESLAFSLMMLSRGVREEAVAFHTDVAAPPHVADVPAGVAHGIAPELVLLHNQAPAVAAASQTPPSLDVVAQGQDPGQVVPSPVATVVPSPVLEQVVPPRKAPGPVVVFTQAREPTAVVGAKKVAPKPKPTITTEARKAPKTVAAQRQSQAPEQEANQAPSAPASQTPPLFDVFAQGQAPGQVVPSPVAAVVPRPVLDQVVPQSQAPAPVLASAQAREPMAVVGTKRAAPKPKPTTTKPRKAPKTVAAQRQSRAPEQAASQELVHECPVCHKAFNKSRSLNIHMNCHPDGRRHPCVFCRSTFPSSSALRSHVRRSNTCGGNNRRRLGPVAAAAIAWHSIDLNMPDI